MGLSATTRRRVLGSLFLLTAVVMVLLGQTVLEECLRGLNYVLYWMACVIMTGLAVLTALLDVRAIQQRSRRDQYDLLTSTVEKIEKDAKARKRRR